MNQPGIHGMVLHGVVEDVQLLRNSGRISSEELAKRLEPPELEWLHQGLDLEAWYPIQSYAHFAQILLEHEGQGDPEYMVRRGAAAAERLEATGRYGQFLHGEQRRSEERAGGTPWSLEDWRLLTTLAEQIFDFGTWSYSQSRTEARIEVKHAAALPELARMAATGFIAHVVSRVRDSRIEVRSERPAPDDIVFLFRFERD